MRGNQVVERSSLLGAEMNHVLLRCHMIIKRLYDYSVAVFITFRLKPVLMKKLPFLFLIVLPFIGASQTSQYAITSYKDEGFKAPNTHYIGEAWLNRVLSEGEDISYGITKATFRANSTLDWHKHTSPQVLIIVEGEGYYQERGKEPVRMKVGDVIKCEKETEHWHASSKEEDVTYLAIYGGSQPTTWTEVLSQEYYDQVAQKLKKD